MIDKPDTPNNDSGKTVNNNLFVGSTSELAKVIADMNKNKDQ